MLRVICIGVDKVWALIVIRVRVCMLAIRGLRGWEQ